MRNISVALLMIVSGCASTPASNSAASCAHLASQLQEAQRADDAANAAYESIPTQDNLGSSTRTSADLAAVQGDFNYAGCGPEGNQ
jgi:hypothetical protein